MPSHIMKQKGMTLNRITRSEFQGLAFFLFPTFQRLYLIDANITVLI